jgi:uncharacterized membrane protein
MKDGTMIRSALKTMLRFGMNAGSSRRAAITVALVLALASLAGTAQASALTAKSAAASSPCKTISYNAQAFNNVGLRLASFTVYTYFCYNNNKVLPSRTTWYTVNISGVGSAGGWSFDGLTTNQAYCAVTDGSTNSCGKVVEVLEAHFQACLVKVGCVSNWYPVIEEDEYYDGSWAIFLDGNLVSYY